MSRRKNQFPSERIRLDGYQKIPITDPREQKAFDWYIANRKERKAFPIAWSLLVAALNGELGATLQKAVENGNTEEAIEALQDLMGAFSGDI